MPRNHLRIALVFFFIGAIVPGLLLLTWQDYFLHTTVFAQSRFVDAAFALWPTGIQIMMVPHPDHGAGLTATIAVLVIQNAILYSVVCLLVAWMIGQLRHRHLSLPR